MRFFLARGQNLGRGCHRIVSPIIHSVEPSHRLGETHHRFSARQTITTEFVLPRLALRRSHQFDSIEQVTKGPNHAADVSASSVDVHESLLDLPMRLASLENRLGLVAKEKDLVDWSKERIIASQRVRYPELLVSRRALDVISVLGFLGEVDPPIPSTSLKVHLLASSLEEAEGVDILNGPVLPNTHPDRLLTLQTVLLDNDVVLSRLI